MTICAIKCDRYSGSLGPTSSVGLGFMQLRTSATKGINIYGIKLVSYSVTFLLIKVCPHLSISLSVLQKKCLSPMFIALAVTMFNFLIKCEYSKLRMSDDPLRLQDSRMS